MQDGLKSSVIQDVTVGATGDFYVSGKYAAGTGNRTVFVRKLNSSGTALWTKTYGTPAFGDARGVTTSSGSIYLTGETQATLGLPNQGLSDAYLRRLNASGTPIWTR